MSKEAGITIHKIRQLNDEAAINVTDSAAVAFTLDVGFGWVAFQNSGTSPVFMGSVSVDANNKRGYEILPKAGFVYSDILENCKIYFKCATGLSTTISVIKG